MGKFAKYKRPLTLLLFIVCVAFLLIAPNYLMKPKPPTAPYCFYATVLDTEGGLLIQPEEGSSERKSADQIYLELPVAVSELSAGDRIEVGYDGVISETYPAKISNVVYIMRAEQKQ